MIPRQPVLVVAGSIALSIALGGCGGSRTTQPAASPVQRAEAPAYADVAGRFNRTVAGLERLSAWTNIRFTYVDPEGQLRTEVPEGRLQIVRPDRLALSLGKGGVVLFWFGSDPERYWWLDLTDKADRVAAVGRHEMFEASAGRRLGLNIRPLDLIRLLGIMPLDPAGPGATQWSDDGRLLGVTSAIGTRGLQRLWLDPDTLVPRTIEIFSPDRRLVLVAEHEGEERVEQANVTGARPRIPARVYVSDVDSGTEIRLTLTGARDGPISDKAFDLEQVLQRYPVDRVIDLDAPPARAAGAG